YPLLTKRHVKLHGWYHNDPWGKLNSFAYFASSKRTIRRSTIQFLLKNRELSRFCELIMMCDSSVVHELNLTGPYSLFVPHNSAFDRVKGGYEHVKATIEANPDKGRDFIRNHSIRGNIIL
ncbi:hypothetical protein FOZ63_007778, partial [Perkinsus olseni]